MSLSPVPGAAVSVGLDEMALRDRLDRVVLARPFVLLEGDLRVGNGTTKWQHLTALENIALAARADKRHYLLENSMKGETHPRRPKSREHR